jgi:hypothetical protein
MRTQIQIYMIEQFGPLYLGIFWEALDHIVYADINVHGQQMLDLRACAYGLLNRPIYIYRRQYDAIAIETHVFEAPSLNDNWCTYV